jgi:hypothetical protein
VDGKLHLFSVRLPICAIGLTAVASCKDPTPIGTSPAEAGAAPTSLNEDCPADKTWLPNTPPVRMFLPPPHPDTECPFYRGAYQNFLIATQPLANGDPAIVRYATLDDAFTHTSTPTPHAVRNTSGRAWLGAVRQAGERNILIDRDHHTLYYGLHMNQAFVDFIKANNLQTVDGILNVDPKLAFPPGLVEFKTAWKDIDPRDFPNASGRLGMPDGIVPPPSNAFDKDPGDYSNYITTLAWIPHLKQDPTTHIIVEEPNNPIQRKMALVAIHCVYTYPGHPEFVWGSIQHVNVNAVDPAPVAYAGVSVLGAPDTQPDTLGPGGMPALPSPDDPQNARVTVAPSDHDYLLFKGGTLESVADHAIADRDLVLDEPSQSFPGQQTSVYRMFPGSKSTTLQPDTAVFSLNSNINVLFDSAKGTLDPNDKRVNYRLVAAIWMDKPAFFGLGPDGMGMPLQNDDSSPLVIGAKQTPPNIYHDVNQGTFCGTPLGDGGLSGNDPNANGSNNTVPGCVTRADSLAAGADPSADFKAGKAGTDSEFSLLGGEDRLSSTAMETFTQNGAFRNCFTCHNTQPISTNGTPYKAGSTLQPLLTKPAMINVSHLFSEFVLREEEEAAAVGH